MKVGVPRETTAAERRVALVPESVKRLTGGGFEIAVERGAGEAASFRDRDYEEAGAALVDDPYAADAVAKVRSPSAEEAARLRDGQILIGFLQPLTDREGIDRLADRRRDGRAREGARARGGRGRLAGDRHRAATRRRRLRLRRAPCRPRAGRK